jgi:RNA polymerase sigma-70 factor (ECF subfamily)
LKAKELETQFENRIKEHQLLIYKVCRIYVYNESDRQDLYQEIVIQLWKAFQTFRGDSKFSTWLYRVALNTAIAGLRKKKRLIQSYEPGNLPNESGDIEYDEQQDEDLKELYIAIEKLNETEKAIVMLYLENKTYEEMEDVLGINQGNLRVKMNRIKDKLRNLTKN